MKFVSCKNSIVKHKTNVQDSGNKRIKKESYQFDAFVPVPGVLRPNFGIGVKGKEVIRAICFTAFHQLTKVDLNFNKRAVTGFFSES